MTFNPVNSIAPYLQTSTFFSEDFDEFRVKFLEVYRNIAFSNNIREIAVYDLMEFLSGQQWFTVGNPQTKRYGYRQAYVVGAIAAGATSTFAHNITGVNSTTTFTNIYGSVVTDFPDNRPVPFASTANVNQQIQITVDMLNINITNGAAAPNITSGTVVLSYLKN